MKIALITENSQAAKNGLIYDALNTAAEPFGHEVFNYGMYTAEDSASLTYVMIGVLAALRSARKPRFVRISSARSRG